ncbi:MAG: dethiobiotin synthase [Chitinivibrionia bacterium]|nr:dethiobiotin synthase [Chitinivibrionia bacterium]
MKKKYTILAPDTDCGKTFATATLLKSALENGENAIACKPVQTGSADGRSPDLDFIFAKAGLNVSPEVYSSLIYRTFKMPASPHLAAYKEGSDDVDFYELVRKITEVSENYDTFFVETAGGIYTPITDKKYNIDLAMSLGFPVILCIPNRVGAISLSVMSAITLQRRGIEIAGAVFSQTIKPKNEDDEEICEDNPLFFYGATGIKVIADIKFCENK